MSNLDDVESASVREFRSLRVMPDIGCPEYKAGICWWKNYQMSLQRVGFFKIILHGNVPGTYAFGDSEQKSTCYRVCQVPFFYKKAESSVESLIVFANITIVDNEVGLFNGKVDLSALNMKIELSSTRGSSKFWLSDAEIGIDDTEYNFWLLLNLTRSFRKNEKEVSLQRS